LQKSICTKIKIYFFCQRTFFTKTNVFEKLRYFYISAKFFFIATLVCKTVKKH
jgi:hypothetical protein